MYSKTLTKEIQSIIYLIYSPRHNITVSNFEEQADFFQVSVRGNLSNAFLSKFADYLWPDKILMYQTLTPKMKKKFENMLNKLNRRN